MAPKRAAASAASPRKSRKAAKAEADPVAEGIQVVVGALGEVSDLTPSCREMVAAMLPHCLSTVRTERHEFQATFCEDLMLSFKKEQASRQAAVEAVEAEQAALKEEEGGASAKLEAARATSAEAEGKRGEARAALEAAKAVTVAAREGLAAAQKVREDAAAGAGELRGQQAALEATLAECWEPLLAGSIPQWRKRDKSIHEIQDALRKIGAAASLLEGAAAAFKTKVGTRGPFAAKAIQFAKDSLDAGLASIKSKIAGAEEQDTTLAANIEEATAAVTAAEGAENGAVEATIAAENVWAEAESAVNAAKDPSFGPRTKELERKHDQVVAEVRMLDEIIAKVSELVERERPAEPEAVEGAEAAAAVPEESATAEA